MFPCVKVWLKIISISIKTHKFLNLPRLPADEDCQNEHLETFNLNNSPANEYTMDCKYLQ